MSRPVRLFFDPLVLDHGTGPMHPENGARVEGCVKALAVAGFRPEAPASPVRTGAAIEAVHSPALVARLKSACAGAGDGSRRAPFSLFDCPDNPISGATFEVVTRTAGLAIAAVDSVMAEVSRRVFVASRPPGHHARAGTAMGFCFFNTIAIAAADLLRSHRLSRVLIADFDVHHGNGTQELFWTDGRVGYLSVHRYPFYPGTGGLEETGAGDGLGATINRPMPAGSRGAAYAGAFVDGLEALASRLRPEFVLVSAGFDSHARDPLGGMCLYEEDFARMTRALVDTADAWAGGRIVSVLEGGYDPDALGRSAVAHLVALSAGLPGPTASP
jgi:acetoin utilization deacetylase AcuC-like enzyme